MQQEPSSTTYSPWPHRWAVALCCATFPLIWVGALVTTKQAGMAVPDWPTTYGYNLFLYPWQTWLWGPFDLFVEHGHRLLGSLVGMLAIGFVASTFLASQPAWLKSLAVVTLVAVIAQGVLGGVRVLLDERYFAMIHGCVGPAFFALCAAAAVLTSRRSRAMATSEQRLDRTTFSSAVLTVALVFAQIILGALLRHVPLAAEPGFFRLTVLFHVGMGVFVACQLAALTWRVLGQHRKEKWLTRPALALAGLMGVQLLLGISTWIVKYAFPAPFSEFDFAAGYTIMANSLWQSLIVTAHVATGAMILATSTLLATRAARLRQAEADPVPFELCARGLAT